MKVAQLLATIPDALPPEYATELTKLQSQAPPMGWAFVKRRMQAELGADWQRKFESFEHHPAAAASLGQVHRRALTDRSVAQEKQLWLKPGEKMLFAGDTRGSRSTQSGCA